MAAAASISPYRLDVKSPNNSISLKEAIKKDVPNYTESIRDIISQEFRTFFCMASLIISRKDGEIIMKMPAQKFIDDMSNPYAAKKITLSEREASLFQS